MKDQIKCPRCGNPSSLSHENNWRPFCCERCRLIDLGDWIEENHHIATDEPINITPASEKLHTKH